MTALKPCGVGAWRRGACAFLRGRAPWGAFRPDGGSYFCYSHKKYPKQGSPTSAAVIAVKLAMKASPAASLLRSGYADGPSLGLDGRSSASLPRQRQTPVLASSPRQLADASAQNTGRGRQKQPRTATFKSNPQHQNQVVIPAEGRIVSGIKFADPGKRCWWGHWLWDSNPRAANSKTGPQTCQISRFPAC